MLNAWDDATFFLNADGHGTLDVVRGDNKTWVEITVHTYIHICIYSLLKGDRHHATC